MESHAEYVLFNRDLLQPICAHINTGRYYKAVIATCRLWHNTIADSKRMHSYMNLMSTLVVNHPEITWPMKDIAYLLRPIELDMWLSQQKENIDEILCELLDDDEDTKQWILKLPDWFIEKYPVINEINQNQIMINLNELFIKTYMTIEDQQIIVQKRHLTLEIIKRYCHLFKHHEWVSISCDNAIDAEFIESHIDKLYFSYLCLNDSFNIHLVEKYINDIDWFDIVYNKNLTPEFIDMYWHKFESRIIYYNCGFDMNLVIKHYDAPVWDILHKNPNLTREFIRDNWFDLDAEIAKHPNVDEALIREHADEEIWTYVLQNPNVTLEFIEEHISRFEVKESINGV